VEAWMARKQIERESERPIEETCAWRLMVGG